MSPHVRIRNAARGDEEQPLLGSDDTDEALKSLRRNLYSGAALVAQAGALLLAGIVFYGAFTHDLIFMSAHPLLNTVGIVFMIEAVLILQPTGTPQQKRAGALCHSGLNTLAATSLYAGLIIIEINKGNHARFESLHAKLGLATYILIFVQILFGGAMYFAPQLFRGEENAKSTWKYHRFSGYVLLVSLLVTACAATLTPYIKEQVGISLWPVLGASLLIVFGVSQGVKTAKLGF